MPTDELPSPEDKPNLEAMKEAASFLVSFDGLKRDPEVLVKLATAQNRIQYAVWRLTNQDGGHRYRALFDSEYKERTRPGLERLAELKEEFDKKINEYHRHAIEYYSGKMSDEAAELAVKRDNEEAANQLNLGHEHEEDYGLDLDGWKTS